MVAADRSGNTPTPFKRQKCEKLLQYLLFYSNTLHITPFCHFPALGKASATVCWRLSGASAHFVVVYIARKTSITYVFYERFAPFFQWKSSIFNALERDAASTACFSSLKKLPGMSSYKLDCSSFEQSFIKPFHLDVWLMLIAIFWHSSYKKKSSSSSPKL